MHFINSLWVTLLIIVLTLASIGRIIRLSTKQGTKAMNYDELAEQNSSEYNEYDQPNSDYDESDRCINDYIDQRGW